MGLSPHLILKGTIYENTITNLHRVVRARHGRDRPDSHSRVCCGAIFSNGNGFADFNDNGIAESNDDSLTRGDPCARDYRLPGTQHDERRSSGQDRKEGPQTPKGFGR